MSHKQISVYHTDTYETYSQKDICKGSFSQLYKVLCDGKILGYVDFICSNDLYDAISKNLKHSHFYTRDIAKVHLM